jgi:hypothetical protein
MSRDDCEKISIIKFNCPTGCSHLADIKQQISQETPTMQVNKTRLAKEFGISRQTLYSYLQH